jgi:hypothetical protein
MIGLILLTGRQSGVGERCRSCSSGRASNRSDSPPLSAIRPPDSPRFQPVVHRPHFQHASCWKVGPQVHGLRAERTQELSDIVVLPISPMQRQKSLQGIQRYTRRRPSLAVQPPHLLPVLQPPLPLEIMHRLAICRGNHRSPYRRVILHRHGEEEGIGFPT